MATVVSVNNNKGGVGKTTSTNAFGELLAYLGNRTLLIDQDPQGNASMQYHLYQKDSAEVAKGILLPEKEYYHIAELYRFRYRNYEDIKPLIRPTYIENLYVLPSSRRHELTQDLVVNNPGNNNTILKRAIKAIDQDFDYILIDNGRANNILTVNSIFASDAIIIPTRCEEYSSEGLQETLKNIIYIKEEHDLERPRFLGAFITQANVITKAFKETSKAFNKSMDNMFFDTAIRQDTKINDIQRRFEPLMKYPNSRALNDYCNLLLEMGILDTNSDKKLRDILKEAM